MMTNSSKIPLFFNKNPVEFDLDYQSKKEPVIRPVTVNTRVNLKEDALLRILKGVEYKKVINAINFPPNEKENWLRSCFTPSDSSYKLATAVHQQTINMIFADLFNYIDDIKIAKKEFKLKYLSKNYAGVIKSEDFETPTQTF